MTKISGTVLIIQEACKQTMAQIHKQSKSQSGFQATQHFGAAKMSEEEKKVQKWFQQKP